MWTIYMNIRMIIISLLLISFTSISFGQPKAEKLNDVGQHFFTKSFSNIQNQQFKITLSDSWFSEDKAHHFLTSAFLSGVGYYFLYEERQFSNQKSQQGAMVFSLSLGLIKEIRDGFKPQNAFSVKDFVADVLGAVVGIMLVSDL